MNINESTINEYHRTANRIFKKKSPTALIFLCECE